jgi:hypothetical protein
MAAPTPLSVSKPTMKTPEKPFQSPIKTYGTGLEEMDIYGALPISEKRAILRLLKKLLKI